MASGRWFGTVFGGSRRRGVSRPRRERDDWYIPLEVGRLEERRVLNVAPIITGANNLASVHQNQPAASNTGTQVAALISGKVTDPDPGALSGIAVTGVNNTNGTWQYTTDGTNWLNFGSPSNTNALLLAADANTYVRFLPSAGFNGTVSPGITFRAWDQTSGTAGGTANTSTNGGSTAFSMLAVSSAVTVDQPISIGGTTTTSINDNQTTSPFSGVTIGDSISASENISVTLTQSATANGVLSNLGGFTDNHDGTYSFTGTAAAATTALTGMTFTPTQHQVAPGNSVNTTFTILASDLVTSTTDSNSVVQATAVNTAPTLSGANNFTPIQVNDTNSSGTLVSALIAGQASDPDSGQTLGIAITATDSTNGKWQYTTDSGSHWHDVGAVSNSNALLLTADANTSLRFVPKANFSGTVSITFRAWDGFTGTATHNANTSSNGGSTAFSSTTASSSILVNDAPTLTGANNLPAINENDMSSSGAFVSALISGKASDADGDSLGIAITAADNSNGTWQYSTDSGANWTNIGSPTAGAALLLPGDATTKVRFVPAANYFGTSSITFQAWDETSGTAEGTADATVNGGATAFSTANASSTIVVNAPPSISGTVAGQTTTDAASINPFSTTVISDPDVPAQTLTVTVQIGTPANGQFTAASLAGWTTVTSGTTYSFTGTAAAATTAIQALVFQPTNHQVVPGDSVTTGFTVTADDHIAPAVTDSATTVIATAINNPPTILGTTANQAVNDNATIQPFSGVTISDPDNSAEPASITVTLDNAANGQFSAASTTSWTVDVGAGTYSFSGTRAQTQAALQGLAFQPTNHQVVPGDTVTTHFTIDLTDGANAATDSNTSVIATAINNPPTIVGAVANQAVNDNATISPFSGVTISDPDVSSEPATITVMLDHAANGQFTAASTTGWTVNVATGTYSFSGTRAQAEAALQALVFAPTNHQVIPGNTVTTVFTIRDNDGGNLASDSNTSVIATAINNPSTIVGTVANQAVNDNATIQPFAGVTISDPDDSAEPATITVTLDHPENGQFTAASTTGWTVDVAAGTYTFSGTRAQAQAALEALVFQPTNHQVIPGNTVTTVFTINDDDGGDLTSDSNTSVVATAINNPPTILGTVANQAVNDNATIQPFAGVTISDPDNSDEPATITVTLDQPLNGQFTAASTTGWTVDVLTGTYIFSGTRSAAQSALRALEFSPTAHQVVVGSTVTTTFTILDNDGPINQSTDSNTTVVATAINDAPVLNPPLVQPLTTITEKDTANAGNTVASFLGLADTDVDFGPLQGIAITGTTVTGFGLGRWQYSTNGGSTWNDIGAVSDSSALLLRPIDLVRFLPDAKNGNMATITYRAWDQTGTSFGKQGTKISAAVNGGTAAFSSATATSAINVQNVNDPPVLTPQTYLLPASGGDSTGAVNGSIVGGLPSTDVDLPVVPFGWSIPSGNNGAFGINSTTGVVSVTTPSLFNYSSTPVVLEVAATESQFAGTPATGTQYLTIQPWLVTTSATQINSQQSTTLTINLVSGVNQTFTGRITWGDEKMSGLQPQIFTVTSNVPMQITHFYAQNPDKANAAQAIPISITVAPTGDATAVSATATTAAPVPGNVFAAIKLTDTTASNFVETARVEIAPPPAQAAAPLASVAQAIGAGAAASESVNPDERLIALRIVSPSDAESDQVVLSDPKLLMGLLKPGVGSQAPTAFKLADTDLNDLPALFKKLPDGRYQIYLSEEGHLRLVIDVVVRQGRAVDPTDDSGGRDRPPTGKIDVGHHDPIVEIKSQFQREINSRKSDVPEAQPIDTTLPDDHQWYVVPLGFASETAATSAGNLPEAHRELAAARSARPVNGRGPVRASSTKANEPEHNHWATPVAAAAATVAVGAGAVLTRERQMDQAMAQLDPRSLSKAARLMRWLKKSK